MFSKRLTVGALGLLVALTPTLVHAQTAAPSASPYGQMQALQSAHVYITEQGSKREIAASAVQIAQSQMGSGRSPGGSMGTNMLKEIGTSALMVAAGPIGMVASSVFHMFGHHPSARPSFHMVLALPSQHSETPLASTSPVIDFDYADTPGIDPDAYTPELLKLTVTKDNWRLVSASDSSDPSAMAAFMMPAGMPMPNHPGSEPPKLTEDRVATASVQILSRGHAHITLAKPLDPGEYGIVLRPVDSHGEPSPQVIRTVWDFSVPSPTAQQ